MKTVSFDQFPDYARVLDGRRDMVAALMDARDLICREPFSCVVIIRDKATLADTHLRCKETLKTFDPLREVFMALPNGNFAIGGLGKHIGDEFSAAALKNAIGTDYADLMTLASQYFPSVNELALRNDDYTNRQFHIDFNSAAIAHPFAGGVTITMSVKGGGTVIVGCDNGELTRQDGMWEMPKTSTLFDQKEQWQVAEGDICIMRAKDWPVTHLPCVHKSPARLRPGDSDERVVGVMLS